MMWWMGLGLFPGSAIAQSYDDLQLSVEPISLSSTAAAARQPGLVAEAQLSTLRLGNPVPSLGILPVVPRLWIGVVEDTKSRIQWSLGLQGAVLAPIQSGAFGSGAGVQGGIAFPGLSERLWTGIDIDVGRFDFTTDDGRIRQFGFGLGYIVAGRVSDRVSIFGQFSGRLNRIVDDTIGGDQTLRLEPRAMLGGSWHDKRNFVYSLGLRAGLRDSLENRFPLALVVSVGMRVGQVDSLEDPNVSTDAPPETQEPTTPSTALPSHPQLFCDPGTLPVGVPPPRGREAWCAIEDDQGRLVRDGLYLRWHTPDTIAERGQYQDDRRTGEWVLHAPNGVLIGRGPYLDGERHGLWMTWFDSGEMASQGSWYKGVPDGEWAYFTKSGTRIEGRWDRGVRDGEWLDYDTTGTVIRRREFLSGQLIQSPE
ncbi:MAG: hypothetical protein AAGA48_25180 [Myxococcota bacterium]